MRADELIDELRKKAFEHEYNCIDEEENKETILVVPLIDAVLALSMMEYGPDVPEGEKALTDIGRKLNIKGKAKAVEYMEMLASLTEYKD